MAIVNVLVGVALLFFGRRAFWLFVAGAGFVAGLSLANNILEVPESVGLIIGIGIGLLAALLAVFVQRFAINLAGFLVGGYIALQLLPMLNIDGGWWTTLLAFIVGGVVGIILVGLFLDWALISLSSLAGAALVMDTLNLSGGLGMVTFIILIVIGFVFQGRKLRGNRRRKR
ncbi:MAG: hypothetical protein PVJ21_00900 [Anaerolineales bacterium]|jgi:hypothetical protein